MSSFLPSPPEIVPDQSDAICASEPIRIPGAIQPHGVLLAIDLSGSPVVTVASANAAALLGMDPLGRRFDHLFGSEFAHDLRRRSEQGDLSPAFPWEATIPNPSGQGALEVACHVHDGLLFIELEAAHPEDAALALESTRHLQRWIGRLRTSGHSIEELAKVACQGIRRMTGYERVLVYRFDPSWHGQAIAEDQVEDWAQSLDGLHFPASDIPRQARELYHHSLLRWVPDRDYTPVPLQHQAVWREGQPVDLSYARLRSLSPIHLQYHRNMGVNGTMSLSVLRDTRLWGLVVCHHRQPHRLLPGQRAAAAALADAFALRVGPAERADIDRGRRNDMQQLTQLLAHMADQNDVAAAVTGGPVTLDQMFGASGAAAVHAGSVVTTGRTPPAADLLSLAAWLRARPEQEIYQTDSLSQAYPAFAQHAGVASGLLAAFLSSDRTDILLWFRPEEAQLVSWGGDPRKQTQGEQAHPTPRQSFERWVETRHGHARPWAEWELEMAGTMRHAITDVVIRSLRRVADLNEQLRQSQKMEAVGQLTGGLAHDFNNLLTGITGSLELLQTRLAQGRVKDVERYVGAAQGAAKRAASLTHRLLAFARRQTLDPRPTDVNRLVAGMEDLVRRTVGPEITVEVVAAGGLWATLIDPNQLENALLNLCINGRDAMSSGGRLTVETANRWLDERTAASRDLPPGQYISLCVSDNGTGMPPEVAERAFDPFFTTKPMGQGTGLGLSMIYGFARQSGGQVRIYTEQGHGTMVCMYLPRHLGGLEPEKIEAAPGHAHPARDATVLVVDDEPTVRMLVAEVLNDLGYTTIEAADGAAGLRVLQSNTRIDLVVTDIGLPGGMNGRQMVQAAQAARPGLKVLFVTGYAENAALSHGHLAPGMQMLTKPFTIQALAAKIDELISD